MNESVNYIYQNNTKAINTRAAELALSVSKLQNFNMKVSKPQQGIYQIVITGHVNYRKIVSSGRGQSLIHAFNNAELQFKELSRRASKAPKFSNSQQLGA